MTRNIELPTDFADLVVALADERADFVVVGGYAVAFHGHPRATKDIDILVRPTPQNAERVYAALAAFGAPLEAFDVSADDFADYQGVLQLGVPPYRIDIINRATGITFDEAVADAECVEIDGRQVPFIGLRALLKNKRATARPQDLADIAALADD
jgi:predicted nucleotidyltransferase